MSLRILLLTILVSVLPALAQNQPKSPATAPTGNQSPALQAPAEEGLAVRKNYILSPSDVIQVKVWREDDLETRAAISRDGTISLPLVGDVTIGGKTTEEAQNLIASLLNKDYLVNPQVRVTVVEFAPRRFTILGHVQKPGQYDFPSGEETMSLIDAIAKAGGYTRIGSASKINVKRSENGKEINHRLNADDMAKGKTKVFQVLPNDIIHVGEKLI
jgi:polysaccharide export outer membrane protein